MKELRTRVKAACISSTAVILFYTILGGISFAPEINNRTVYELLVLNFAVAIVMYITDKLPFKTVFSWMAGRLAGVFLVVFLLGGVIFKMFPFHLPLLAVISAMLILVFFIVIGVMYIEERTDADSINKKLKVGRSKNCE